MTNNESRYTDKDLNMPKCSIICTFLILFSIKFRIFHLSITYLKTHILGTMLYMGMQLASCPERRTYLTEGI